MENLQDHSFQELGIAMNVRNGGRCLPSYLTPSPALLWQGHTWNIGWHENNLPNFLWAPLPKWHPEVASLGPLEPSKHGNLDVLCKSL